MFMNPNAKGTPLASDSAAGANTEAHGEPQALELIVAPKSRRPWIVVTALVLILLIVAASVSFLRSGSARQSTNDAYIEGRIIRVSPKVFGQVVDVDVNDNDRAEEGETLLQIDPADYQARVDQAAAAVVAAQSAAEQAKAAVLRADAGVGEAQAVARAAETESTRRASDYRRYAAVGTDGVSEQQLETAKHAADAADAEKEAAAKKAVAAAAELNVARTNVGTAEAQVTAAKAQLRYAELQLQYTMILAPASGVVTKKNVESGDFVGAGQPLLAVVPDERWVIANFKEVQLQHMRIGQPASVRVDSFPGVTFRARVQSLQAGTGSRFQLLPPENATGNWVKVVQRLPVKIVFEPDQAGLDRLAQGMSAEVTVETSR
jgi:membrane fusion protein (multidrug efflux system)